MAANNEGVNTLAGAQQQILIKLLETMHPTSLFLPLEGGLPLFTELPRETVQ
jgi:hypothetical protein